MKFMVEISMYPLVEKFIPHIQTFIDRLNSYAQIEVETNATSTHVIGDCEVVMQILGREMQHVHEQVGQTIFVAKFLSYDAMQARQ